MSVARQRRRSAKRIANGASKNPVAILATDIDANDNIVVGTREIREVRVTERVSIKRTFDAPRIEMGEYTPVRTVDIELDKLCGQDWSA